jgi:hypothetical protein
MKRLLIAAALLLLASPALAASQGFVVASCPGSLGVNAYTAGQYGNITVDVNGIQCVSGSGGGGGGGTSSNFAAAFPAAGTAAGFTDGTNMVAAKVRTPGSTATTSDPAIVVIDPNVLAALNGAATAANQTSQITQETATAAALGTTTDAVAATPSTGSAATLIALAKAINNNVSSSIPAGTNRIGDVGVPSWAGGVLGAMANYGTSPGAVLVPGMNAFVTNTVTVNGTVTTTPPANASTNVAQVNGITTLTGAGATGTGSQRETVAQDTTTIAGSAPGTAGTASANVVTVQGIASMTKLLVTPDSVALPANQSVNVSQVNGVTVLTGTGATGTGAQRVTISTDQATNAGAALKTGGVGVVNGGSTYNTVAASQSAQALTGGGGGATGDYLSHCVLQPTTTAAGTMTIADNATTIFTFTTGTLSNLAPIAIPIGAVSTSGAWKITTGANETATCFGKFT